MDTKQPEARPGIKRRPSSRDELLTNAAKDISKGILNLFKKIFLNCIRPITFRATSEGYKTRDHIGKRVTEVIPLENQKIAVHPSQNLSPSHSDVSKQISSPKESAAPTLAVGTQVDKPASETTVQFSTLPQQASGIQASSDHEQSQPLIKTERQGLGTRGISSESRIIVSPLEHTSEPSSTETEQSNAVSEASTKHDFEGETSSKASKKPTSNHGSITFTLPGAWPKTPGSAV